MLIFRKFHDKLSSFRWWFPALTLCCALCSAVHVSERWDTISTSQIRKMWKVNVGIFCKFNRKKLCALVKKIRKARTRQLKQSNQQPHYKIICRIKHRKAVTKLYLTPKDQYISYVCPKVPESIVYHNVAAKKKEIVTFAKLEPSNVFFVYLRIKIFII